LIEVILNESIQIELAVSSGVEAVEDVENLEGETLSRAWYGW